jgi:hypothetical protein
VWSLEKPPVVADGGLLDAAVPAFWGTMSCVDVVATGEEVLMGIESEETEV